MTGTQGLGSAGQTGVKGSATTGEKRQSGKEYTGLGIGLTL